MCNAGIIKAVIYLQEKLWKQITFHQQNYTIVYNRFLRICLNTKVCELGVKRQIQKFKRFTKSTYFNLSNKFRIMNQSVLRFVKDVRFLF